MCPIKVRKVDGFRVTHGGKVSAKSTTKAKAEGQARLLRGLAHGMIPRGSPTVHKRMSTKRGRR